MTSPMTSFPKVSVYVPACNAAKVLATCLEGLLAQTLLPDEILVIDDGSRDASAEIGARYPGVQVIRHPFNKGLAAARNTAMHAARNELVASLDADCIAHPEWLAELARHLSVPPLCGVGGKLIEGFQGTVADRWRAVHMPQHWGDSPVLNPQFLFGSNNLFRRSAVLDVHGYDESLRTNGEDVDLCSRLRKKGYDLLYVPSAQATHLRRDSVRSILDTYWRWWRFGVNAYATGVRLRSVIGHAMFVHFRYNFLSLFRKDFAARRWKLLALDFLVLGYFPFRDFLLWLDSKFGSGPKESLRRNAT